MILVDDLITAGVSIIEKLIVIHEINEWAKLYFGFIFTFVTTYSSGMGASLVAGKSFAISIGTGLLAGSSAITALFFLNPRTRKIMIVQDKSLLNTQPDISNYQSVEKTK